MGYRGWRVRGVGGSSGVGGLECQMILLCTIDP